VTENALIGFGNYVDDGEIGFSGGSWYPTLPLTNLASREYGQVARSTSLDPAATRFDFAWPQRRFIRVVAWGPHNVKLRGKARLILANDAAFAEPVYDSGLIQVWPRVYDFGDIPWGSPNWWTGQYTEAQIARLQRPMIWILPQALTARYGRLLIEDEDNPAGYIQSGRLFAADALQPSRSFVFGGEIGIDDLSEQQRSLSGARYFTERSKARFVNVEWGTLSEKEAMNGFFELQQQMGLTGECLFVWNPADTVNALRRQFFCTLRSLSALPAIAPDIWRAPVTFEELL